MIVLTGKGCADPSVQDADPAVQDADPAVQDADRVLAALVERLRGAEALLADIRGQAEALLAARRTGRPWRSLVEAETRPLLVERITVLIDDVADAGAAWRRAEVAVLAAEGMTRTRIAELFGVTRQRVSALLRPAPPPEARQARRPHPPA